MKLYHPSAHVVKDGKICGMILHEGFKPDFNVISFAANMQAFERLVEEGKVQLFEIEDSKVVLKYTDEEKDTILKKSKHKFFTLKDYLENDAAFNAEDIFGQEGRIAISILAIKVMIKVPIVQGVMYRSSKFTKEEVKELKDKAYGTVTRISDNEYFIAVNAYSLLYYLRDRYPNNFGVNFDTALHDNMYYQIKQLGFKSIDKEDLNRILDLYNTLK